MGSLSSHEDILNQIVQGKWAEVLPKEIFASFSEWALRQYDSEELVVRLTFCNSEDDSRYAIYMLCHPSIGEKVIIRGYKSQKDRPLAMLPSLYDKPLFCMPNSLLERIVKERDGDG